MDEMWRELLFRGWRVWKSQRSSLEFPSSMGSLLSFVSSDVLRVFLTIKTIFPTLSSSCPVFKWTLWQVTVNFYIGGTKLAREEFHRSVVVKQCVVVCSKTRKRVVYILTTACPSCDHQDNFHSRNLIFLDRTGTPFPLPGWWLGIRD